MSVLLHTVVFASPSANIENNSTPFYYPYLDGIKDSRSVNTVGGLDVFGMFLNTNNTCASSSIITTAKIHTGKTDGVFNNICSYSGIDVDFAFKTEGNAQWNSPTEVKIDNTNGNHFWFQPKNTDFDDGDIAVYSWYTSKPVSNVAFKWGGMDQNDYVEITAFLKGQSVTVNGNNISDINLNSNGTFIANTVHSTAGGSNMPNNAFQFNLDATVDSIVVKAAKKDGGRGNVTMQLWDLQFCLPTDTDNDGVIDIYDLDDDNDGILDCSEGTNNLNEFNSYVFTSPTLELGSALTEGAKYRYENVASGVDILVTVKSINPNLNFISLDNTTDPNGARYNNFEPILKLKNGVTMKADEEFSVEFLIEFVKSGSNILENQPNITLTAWDTDGDLGYTEVVHFIDGTEGVVNNPTQLTMDNSNGIKFYGNHTFNSGINLHEEYIGTAIHSNTSSIPIRIAFKNITNTKTTGNVAQRYYSISAQYSDLESYNNKVFANNITCFDLDTDKDGIVDRLDTDSDNDGCPDALEGGDKIASNNVGADDRLTGTVNATTGIPNNVNNGQSVGVSLNPFIEACTDTDKDGIADIYDLDDDNDGILDSTEQRTTCDNSIFDTLFVEDFGLASLGRTKIAYTTDYCYEDGSGLNCPVSNNNSSLNDGEYTIHNSVQDIAVWASSAWTTTGDHTTGNDRMALFNGHTVGSTVMLVEDIVIHPNAHLYVDMWMLNIDKDNDKTRLMPKLDVNVKDKNGNLLKEAKGIDIIQNEEWQEVKIDLGFVNLDTIDIEFINNVKDGNGNDFAIDDIVVFQAFCDTDNDGFANYLDTDSDNDGCSDANETYANTSIDTNSDGTYGGLITSDSVNSNGLVVSAGLNLVGDAYTKNVSGAYLSATKVEVDASALVDQILLAGQSTSFTVTSATATSTDVYDVNKKPDYSAGTDVSSGLKYQWQIDGVDITDGGVYSGASTTTLNISDVTGLGGKTYTLIVIHPDNVCDEVKSSAYLVIDTDTDKDGIADIFDIDDDNDGITDSLEMSTCETSLQLIPDDAINNSIDTAALHDGTSSPDTIVHVFTSPGCSVAKDTIIYKVTAYPSERAGTGNMCADTFSFVARSKLIGLDKLNNCRGGVIYRIEFLSGPEILNITNRAHGNLASDEAVYVKSHVSLSGKTYKRSDFTSSDGNGTNNGPKIIGDKTNEVGFENVSGPEGGNKNVWEVSSNNTPVNWVEIEYFRTNNSLSASFESFFLEHKPLCDEDCDGIPNHIDIDSDNDGIPDNVEAQTTKDYVAPSGKYTDNGLDSAYYTTQEVLPTNTDGVDKPDYLDNDSDNDGFDDKDESGFPDCTDMGDTDKDGLYNCYDDVNGMDVNDDLDTGARTLSDTDNDLDIPKYHGDVDFRDATENKDTDKDGILDIVDIDDDNDGIIDEAECGVLFTEWSGGDVPVGTLGDLKVTTSTNAQISGTDRPAREKQGVSNFIGNRGLTLHGHIFTDKGVYNMGDNNQATYEFTFDKPTAQIIYVHVTALDTDISFSTGNIISITGGTGLNTSSFKSEYIRGYPNEGGLTATIPVGTTELILNHGPGGDNYFLTFSMKCKDSDADNIADHNDIDADNDGIPDNLEAQSTKDYIKPSGKYTDKGLDSAYFKISANGLTPENTDGKDDPDYLDADSDNDGFEDSEETGFAVCTDMGDTDKDGLFNCYDNEETKWAANDTLSLGNLSLSDEDNDKTTDDVDYRDEPIEAKNDTVIVSTNDTIKIDVKNNDYIKTGQTATIDSCGGFDSKNGTAKIVNDSIQYIPKNDFYGIDSFEYCLKLGNNVDTGVVVIQIKPHSKDDSYTGAKVSEAVKYAILDNDDFKGNNLTITKEVGGTALGTVSFENDSLVYTPNVSEANKTVTLKYEVCDTRFTPEMCDTAWVSIQVDALVIKATDDNASGVNGYEGLEEVVDIYANDSLNEKTIDTSKTTLTQVGTSKLVLNTDGTVDVLEGTAAGTYTLDYKICEKLNPTNCDNAKVTVEVDAAEKEAINDKLEGVRITEPKSIKILDNDEFDPGINTSLVDLGTGNAKGVISFNNITGELTYTPTEEETGDTVTVDYKVCDNTISLSLCDSATVTVIIVNDYDKDGNIDNKDPNKFAPTAVNDTIRLAASGVSSKLNIVDNDDFLVGSTLNSTGGSAKGVVSFNETTGEITYTPTLEEAGKTVTVGYKVCNTPENVCADALVVIEVVKNPVAKDDKIEDARITEPKTIKVLDNDEFTAGNDITLADKKTGTAKGVALLNPLTGELTYTPTEEESGETVTIVYEVCESDRAFAVCDKATVTIDVSDDYDSDGNKDATDPNKFVPTAKDEFLTIIYNNSGEVDILENDDFLATPNNTSIDILNPNAAKGSLTVNEKTGIVTYTPIAAEIDRSIVLEYKVCNTEFTKPVCEEAKLTINVLSDNDLDGIPDHKDLDDDNDGILDVDESHTVDTDNDGIVDAFDIDSDNDGILDIIEAGIVAEPKFEGIAYGDIPFEDKNKDGVNDLVTSATPIDSDKDGILDYLDLDADNDGIPDNIEGQSSKGYLSPSGVDTDKDGLDDMYDIDCNKCGTIVGSPITPNNLDRDTKPDYLDLDSDNDLLPDTKEAAVTLSGKDTDKDGLDDSVDKTNGYSNPNINVSDVYASYPDKNKDDFNVDFRQAEDFDFDGVVDTEDLDDDNDGILDIDEGILTNRDSDNDGIPDYQDLDSDNDGILDIMETGGTDPHRKGNYTTDFVDANNNGLHDSIEVEPGVSSHVLSDFDGDGYDNYVDLDADNDGIPDVVEGQTTAGFIPNQHVDIDGDGIDDAFDNDCRLCTDILTGNPIEPINTDGEDTPDYIDLDSDNDLKSDLLEGQMTLLGVDKDGDGLDDAVDDKEDGNIGSVEIKNPQTYYPDTYNVGADVDYRQQFDFDFDGLPDVTDPDDDNDGITDIEEGTADFDKDGVPNYYDLDSDNDGVLDQLEKADDLDGDGAPNFLDLDSDGDDLYDVYEAELEDTNNDGIYDEYDLEEAENPNFQLGQPDIDTDGDGIFDFFDEDSDGDGIPDDVESQGVDVDTDGDGIVDRLDLDSDNDGIPDSIETVDDYDNDGTPNYLDLDSDNDSVIDEREGTEDQDGDGDMNFLDLDSDGDLLFDEKEDDFNKDDIVGDDCDNDGTPNFLDPDLCEVFIPESFSPNGDGANDYLEILGIEGFPENKFEVYNRWGVMVYTAEGSINNWDGVPNTGPLLGQNDVLPVGTYYYVIKLKKTGYKPKVGFIYLNK